MAGALIFLGLFLDSVDGSVARLTRSVTELGATLDSLSDLVTCGVAPAVMVLSLVASYLGTDGQLTILGPDADLPWGKVVWGIAAVYVCCTALRTCAILQSKHNLPKGQTTTWQFSWHAIPRRSGFSCCFDTFYISMFLQVAEIAILDWKGVRIWCTNCDVTRSNRNGFQHSLWSLC